MLPPDREAILASKATVRLITGKPGVGKTYFGCQIAKRSLSQVEELGPQQRVLFLTYARNAVARIRQGVFASSTDDGPSSEADGDPGRREVEHRIRLNTFHGFFWWLVECYGRYADGGSRERPWLLGSRRIADDVPPGYRGYTFAEIEEHARKTMEVRAVRSLISSLYPLVIVDEFQDIEPALFNIVALLGRGSRLVLLAGPGQTIYRSLKKFDPEEVARRCEQELQPEKFDIAPVSPDRQRFSEPIRSLVCGFERGSCVASATWPVVLKSIPRKNKNDIPNLLGTHSAICLAKLERYLRGVSPQAAHFTIAVLASTNDAVADISYRIGTGSEAYKLSGRRVSAQYADTVLLQYGRLLLELLRGHWICGDKRCSGVEQRAARRLAAVFQEYDSDGTHTPEEWVQWANCIRKKAGACQKPSRPAEWQQRLDRNIATINDLLRATKADMAAQLGLPPRDVASPSTAFNAAQSDLLAAMAGDLREIIAPAVACGVLDLPRAQDVFERAMQQRVIFEKIGLEPRIQVMTIHKAKGREFDGVVLVLEDNHKAFWKASKRMDEEERLDLYRVAITRARQAFALVAFEDAYTVAAPVVRRLLPQPPFRRDPDNV